MLWRCRWPVTALALSLACSSAPPSTGDEASEAQASASTKRDGADASEDEGADPPVMDLGALDLPPPDLTPVVSPPDTERLEALLNSGQAGFVTPMRDPERFRIQVLVTTFTSSPKGPVQIAEYRYRPDAEFIYVASAIKTYGSVSVLLELQRLQQEGHPVGLDTPVAFCPSEGTLCQTLDKTNVEGGVFTIGHELRKIHLVSNNHAFNNLYDLLGHREINEAVWALGFPEVRIRHRFQDSFQSLVRRTTPRVELRPPGADPVIFERRVSNLELSRTPASGVRVGTQHMGREGVEDGPKDFNVYNYSSLGDLHRLTLAIHRPEHPDAPEIPLSKEHREFLRQVMAELPSESKNPVYDRPEAHFRYKLMLRGVLDVLPLPRVRYANKPGRAHGFHLDTAYIEDRQTGRAMVVTAAIRANHDDIVSERESVYNRYSRPFFRSLGETLTRVFLLDETITEGSGEPAPAEEPSEGESAGEGTLYGE